MKTHGRLFMNDFFYLTLLLNFFPQIFTSTHAHSICAFNRSRTKYTQRANNEFELN